MTWFDEVRPAFLVCQTLGLLAYTIVAGIPAKSRSWRIYVRITLVLYLCNTFGHYVDIPVPSDIRESRSKLLKLIAVLSIASTFAVHSLTVSCSFDKMKILFDLINEYDRTLRIDFATKSFVIRTWLICSLPTFFFVYFQTRQLSNQPTFVKVIKMNFVMFDMAWYVIMLKFVILLKSIERRLKQLHSLITANTPKIMYDRNDCSRPLCLNDTCRLHDILVSAANILNSIYHLFLPFWIIEASAFAIIRIHYAINAYRKIASSEMMWHCVRELPSIISLLYCFTSCHNTNVAANKIGSAALSPRSWLLYERFQFERDEGFKLGQHFALQPFHFTAGYGLFVIELIFLGSMLGVIMTILVMLSA